LLQKDTLQVFIVFILLSLVTKMKVFLKMIGVIYTRSFVIEQSSVVVAVQHDYTLLRLELLQQ